MIPIYTRSYLSMHMYGSIYYLPFEDSLSSEEAFAKTLQLFSESKIYERELYTDRSSTPSVSHEKNQIRLNCLYEGCDDYYPFTIVLEVFRLTDGKNQNHPYLISMRMEHVYEGLLEELLDIKVVPSIVSKLNLKAYSYLNPSIYQ